MNRYAAFTVAIALLASMAAEAKTPRNTAARNAFIRQHPCPATGQANGPCPGYVVDHIVPLKRGGSDTPVNMQWQTKEEAKAKDKWE